MISLNNNYKFSIFFLAFVFALHILTVNYLPVNSEYMFFKGADFLKYNNKEITNIFYSYQANTLGFSYLIKAFSDLVNVSTEKSAKILSSFSYFFLIIGLYNFGKILKVSCSITLFLMVVIFNPLVWNYGFRGSPDLLSFSLCLFSFVFLVKNSYLFSNFFFSILMAIGIILKPINGIYLVLLFFYDFKNLINLYIKFYFRYFIIFLILVCYFFYNFINFGFVITPPAYSGMGFSFVNFFSNFVYYIGFSFFIIFPYSFCIIYSYLKDVNKKKLYFIIISVLLLFFLLSLITSQNQYSEISFGFLNFFLSKEIYNSIICFNFVIFFFTFFVIFFKYREINNNKNLLFIFFTIIIYLLIISFFGPGAQRYLLATVPLYVVFFLIFKKFNWVNYIFIFLFLILNFLLFGNYYNNHKINNEIVNFLKVNKIIFSTNPGPLGSHVLHEFVNFYDKNFKQIPETMLLRNRTYFVVSENNLKNDDEIVFYAKSNYFNLLKRKVFVIKVNSN